MKPKKNIEEHLFKNLGAYQSINIEEDWQKVKGRMSAEKSRRLSPFWRIAAAVILLLGVGFIAQKYLAPSPEMIAVLSGEQMKEVLLPDGSMVTLNRQAELVYPEKFNRRQRELKLRGEAFFEVVSNPSLPFVVDVDERAQVRVLGTSFNIDPDRNGESISVQVIEGKVAFSSLKGPDEIILVKDEQATFRKGSISRDDVVDRNSTSWKTGVLFFENTDIGEVLKQLQAHYEIEIVLDQSVPGDLSFTSTLDKQELESVLDEISLVLGLEYNYENEKVVFTLSE
jgi:transmembrane sensor